MNHPNVLFLLSDEHSFRFFGHVDADNGGEPAITPTLDRLAATGMTFSDAYCSMPLCTPSRLCLLSGREVRRAGAWDNCSVLRPELPTIGSVFSGAGYETCLVGKMHLGGSVQFAGFGHRPYGDLTGKTGHQWEPLAKTAAGIRMRERTADAAVTEIPESLLQDQIVAHETVAFLKEHAAADPHRPWMLCASFSRPHFPLTAPRRWFDAYERTGVTEPKVPAAGDAYDHPMSVGMREGFRADEIEYDETMRARLGYFACVSYLDEVLGDLLLRLEAAGLLDNTIIVYTTDHGELAGEHGVWWKNGWYEGCTRVPWIVSLPEHRRGTMAPHCCRTPVGLADLLPTLCGLAGVPVPDDLDGTDLSLAVRGQADAPERPIFCDALMPRWGEGTEFRSIRWRNYKYVRFRNAAPLMFDLATDPGEQHNLLERGCEGEALAARDYLAKVAAESIDFDAAETERLERDGDLRDKYPLAAENSGGNLYFMPTGRVVNADTILYHPSVVFEQPEQAFADWPGRNS